MVGTLAHWNTDVLGHLQDQELYLACLPKVMIKTSVPAMLVPEVYKLTLKVWAGDPNMFLSMTQGRKDLAE